MSDECLYWNERIVFAEMDGPDVSGKGRIRREIEPDSSWHCAMGPKHRASLVHIARAHGHGIDGRLSRKE
jgi:hypothetical protein